MKDRLILESPEKMCEYCCNFDKENIGMDGTALCKLTMTLAYAEDYGGNCMFYNVPKEQIIIPPCKVGDVVYVITSDSPIGIEETKVSQIKIKVKENGKVSYRISAPCVYDTWGEAHWTFCAFEFGKTVFLTKEEAEQALKERNEKDGITE